VFYLRGTTRRPAFAESLLLATLGTLAGLLLNLLIAAAANRIRLPLPLRIQIQPDCRLLGYAIALAMVSALVCCLLPALKATKRDVQTALKLGERSVTARLGFRRVLVIAQLASSVVLLLTGFLFLRNLLLSNSLNPGFDIRHTVWAYVRLVPERYSSKDPAKAKTKSRLSFVGRWSSFGTCLALRVLRRLPLFL
jgi:hypothetical protein